MVEKAPNFVAWCFNQHPCLNGKHVDIIVEKMSWHAAKYLSHKLSEKNILYISKNHPELIKEGLK